MIPTQSVKAFSLIELMIVITIIGILAAVAVPAYQDYVIRSKVLEFLPMGRDYQNRATEYYQLNGALPTGCPGTILPDVDNPTSNISKVRWCNSQVEVLFNSNISPDLNNKWAIIAATISNGVITWQCGTHSTTSYIPCKYLPSNCQFNCNLH